MKTTVSSAILALGLTAATVSAQNYTTIVLTESATSTTTIVLPVWPTTWTTSTPGLPPYSTASTTTSPATVPTAGADAILRHVDGSAVGAMGSMVVFVVLGLFVV